MIPQQLSTINSLILNVTLPLSMTPVRRRRSGGNILDQPSYSRAQRKDVNTCTCKENPSVDIHPSDSRNISEVDSKSHQKEISFNAEPRHRERSPNKYITTLGTVRIELPVEESTKL